MQERIKRFSHKSQQKTFHEKLIRHSFISWSQFKLSRMERMKAVPQVSPSIMNVTRFRLSKRWFVSKCLTLFTFQIRLLILNRLMRNTTVKKQNIVLILNRIIKFPVNALKKNHVKVNAQKTTFKNKTIRRAFAFCLSVSLSPSIIVIAIGINRLAYRYCTVNIQSCRIKNRSPKVANILSTKDCAVRLSLPIRLTQYIMKLIQKQLRRTICMVTNKGLQSELRFPKMQIEAKTVAIAHRLVKLIVIHKFASSNLSSTSST